MFAQVLDDLRHKLESEERSALADLQKTQDAELARKTKEMKQKHERVRTLPSKTYLC